MGSRLWKDPFLQSTSTNVPTLWSGDPDAQNEVTSSANVTLSTELRKHGDMRLSDCPKRDLSKIPAGHEEPSTLTGKDLRLAVETGGTAVWTAAGPTVSLLICQPACPSETNRNPVAHESPGVSCQGEDGGGCPNLITSALPYSTVSFPCLHLGARDNGLPGLLLFALLIPV